MRIFAIAFSLFLLDPHEVSAEPLTGETLTKRVAGQTFEVRRMAMRMELGFRPDGSLEGQGPLGKMMGHWAVEGDQLCMELPRMGRRCGGVTAMQDGSLVLFDGQRLTPVRR